MTDTLDALTHEDASAAGFFGARVDPTPNSAYTVAGTAAGEPTPETDADAKAAAASRTLELANAMDPGEGAPKSKSTKASAS